MLWKITDEIVYQQWPNDGSLSYLVLEIDLLDDDRLPLKVVMNELLDPREFGAVNFRDEICWLVDNPGTAVRWWFRRLVIQRLLKGSTGQHGMAGTCRGGGDESEG